jgi:acetyl/propionyl-CoA carboxylase alpha subunit
MAPIRRLLIANRGEIAVRVVQACRELSIDAVVAVTEGERGSLPATLADAVAPVASYLDADALVAAAIDAGADAVHPGYGFLAEDAAFAEAVIGAGLTWVGPPPEAMRRLGDKVAARSVAAGAGVPVVPGAELHDRSDDEAVEAATSLGFPVLVKAAGGGGGRGMRRVDDADSLLFAIDDARREAEAGFGDERVFLERRLEHVRHVEVQVVLDEHGSAAHLGERDCSLQRRHQKVVEEAPSPAVDARLRAALGDAAVAVAVAAGYVGVGTAEFLVAPEPGREPSWWFLEMNARLQVEHGVTEAVTGVDLVRAQLAIAGGAPSPIGGEPVASTGHAIEARIYAEDPARGFLPTGGRIELASFPRWPGVRVDTAVQGGETIGLGFDPLLAKVIAHAEDRPAALAKLRAALAEVRIVGVATNLGFLFDALAHPDVVAASADTDWIERSWTPDVPPLPEGVGPHRPASDAWAAFGGASTPADVTVVGTAALYRGWSYDLGDVGSSGHAEDLASADTLTAPMPASVVRVEVAPGDAVAEGALLATLEAMKLQVQVTAPARGTVREVLVRPGDVVARGQALIELDAG